MMDFEIDMESQFQYRFSNAGSNNAYCECGREHISMHAFDDWDFAPEESTPDEMRASYEEEAAKNDMMVLDYENDGFSIIDLSGHTWVAGCQCKGWIKYMEFLIDNRQAIAGFLVDTSKEIKRIQAYEKVMDILADEYDVKRSYAEST